MNLFASNHGLSMSSMCVTPLRAACLTENRFWLKLGTTKHDSWTECRTPLPSTTMPLSSSCTTPFNCSPPAVYDFARHIQHLVAVELVPQPGDDGVVEVVSRCATVYQHVYGAVDSVVSRPRDRTDRTSRLVAVPVMPPKMSGVVFETTRA